MKLGTGRFPALLLNNGRVVMSDRDVDRIVVEQLGSSVWVVELSGEHDLANAADLHTRLEAIFATGTTIVIDLSPMTFMDSSILTELILAQQRADADPDEQLAIVAPSGGFPARLISMVDAGPLLSPFETRAQALAWLGHQEPETA
jgi:anti-anti-sigma factor